MSFNIALSGLSAASSDLKVTGNNIANASTIGFKSSRAEFADIYASSLLGGGSNQIGSGVKLANVKQRFDQGSISFTNSSLDLAIDGDGFFVLSDGGERAYSRGGAFSIDVGTEGYIISGTGARVQGFTSNQTGSLSGVLGDLQVNTSSLPPLQTTTVEANANLDARADILSEFGTLVSTMGSNIGVARLGLPNPTPTRLETSAAPSPFDFGVDTTSSLEGALAVVPFDFTGTAASNFEVTLTGSGTPSENTTAIITLDSNITTLQDLLNDIRNDLAGTGIGLDVREDPSNIGRLQFYAVNSGEDSVITLDSSNNFVLGTGVLQGDLEATLGGIALGQAGGSGASNVAPDPYGGTSTTGTVGNLTAASFDLTLSGSSGNNGTATITLDSDVSNATELISAIQSELTASGISVLVQPDPLDSNRIQFVSTVPGELSTISVTNLDVSNIGVTLADLVNVLSLTTGVSIPGIPAARNGYEAQSVDVVYPDGSTIGVDIPENSSAAQIAAQFATMPEVSATALTAATISEAGYNNSSGTMQLSINGVVIPGATLQALADSINVGLPGLGAFNAELAVNGDLIVTNQGGNDIVVAVTGGLTDTLDVLGTQGLAVTLDTLGDAVVAVGGEVNITLSEGVTLGNAQPVVTNLFDVLDPSSFTGFALNTFDPDNQDTYNAATSVTIFDSLGNSHTLEQYFVKERFTPGVLGEEANRWTMYILVDGQDVGDPDPNLPSPQNQIATRAQFNLQFNTDGTLDPLETDPILISNWVPLNTVGVPNGAVGPLPVLSGGAVPVEQPPSSSNFEIRLNDSTQFGREFSLSSIEQNGYATGKLSGLAIDDEGVVFARFTNGQTTTLGQVAIADFSNSQGLSSTGDSSWVETSQSGAPVIGAPGSGSLGSVVSGALEDSNVDLSEELVRLIIAQRNFQANSRTISTADEILQTIINV